MSLNRFGWANLVSAALDLFSQSRRSAADTAQAPAPAPIPKPAPAPVKAAADVQGADK